MSNHYQHHWMDSTPIDLPLGKAVCVGRNYAAHAKELGNEIPTEPLLFMKPATAFCALEQPLHLPKDQGEIHHEIEMVALIGKRLHRVSDEEEVRFSIEGYGLGLD